VASASPAEAQTRTFDVPAEAAAQGIPAFARQAGVQIIASGNVVRDRRTNAVQGAHTVEEGLRILLSGTGLAAGRAGATGIITIVPSAEGNATAAGETAASKGEGAGNPGADQETVAITVTGTRIRNAAAASPTITIDAKTIKEEGFTDLGEVIRSVPQNFNGGQNPGIVGGAEGGGIANQNISGGSSLNLRGLGPDATLTLLNGRRLPYSGFVQAVDISAIPVDAVDRLEIIPDGASAIYGSDAVGGVGNVILKRDFTGLTVGAQIGGATDGGLGTREYTLTTGARWDGGGFILAGKRETREPIYARQRAYSDYLPDPITLYPDTDLTSGLLSVHQSVGSAVQLRLDALRSRRDQVTISGDSVNYYPSTPTTTTTFVSPTVEVSLPKRWLLTIGGAWGKDDTIAQLAIVPRATGTLIPFARSLYRNKNFSYEIGAEGPLFALPGGEARLALGAGYKKSQFLQRSLISGQVSADGEDSSRFAYAEANLPLIGPQQGISGVRRLVFTAAVRGEDYASSGTVVTPKLGMIYDPSADVRLKATWGRSFKAPTLLQLYQTQFSYLYPAASVGGVGYPAGATVLMPYGGNPDLKPERARTWSASAGFHPSTIPGLEAELSWFDIHFTDRIAQPLVSLAQALSNPGYAEFIEYSPTAEEQASIIAASQFLNFSGAPYDPANVVAIAYNRYINTTAQHGRGLDFSGSYSFDVGSGRLAARGSLSWLDSKQKATSTDPVRALSGTLFYPAKVNGRAGAVWTGGGFSVAVFANYTSSVTNPANGERTGSFTTLDANVRYLAGTGHGWLSGVDIALTATNLFDRAPPLYTPTSPNNPPYDSTNYSPVGRFLSISISKHL
jgi:outer membrane receptor protein involved in Fe transport